jgi:hypothetical protein
MFDGYEPLNDSIDQKMDRIEMDIKHHLDLPKLTKEINNWSSQVSSKFGVYKFLVFSEILIHSFKPPILDYTNRECQPW